MTIVHTSQGERVPRRARPLIAVAAVLMFSATVTACGSDSDSSSSSSGGGKTTTVGFLYVGPKNDFGYNQAQAQAATALKKMPGVKVVEEENVPETVAVQKTMEAMINQDKATLIFPTSFGYFDPHMLKMAEKYPKVRFAHCGGMWTEGKHPKNTGSYFGYIDECQYLAGVVAAHPNDVGARFNHALALLKAGRPGEALAVFDNLDVMVDKLPPGLRAVSAAVLHAAGDPNALVVVRGLDPELLTPGEYALIAPLRFEGR